MKPKILTTLKSYSWVLFAADVLAGITVAMVAIPLSIAIAIASGADPAKGLITSIIGGGLISLLGGSRVQIGGPTGAFIVVVFGVISIHGYDGLVLATLMAGVILLIAGLLRAGNLITFVPESVVNGFTLGIAVILAISQLKDMFGLTLHTVPANFIPKVEALWGARASASLPAILTALSTLVLIVLLRWRFPRLPGLIVAIALAAVVVFMLHLPVDTIASRYGVLPHHLPLPSLPPISLARMSELLPSAFVIAFLAAVESLLSAMVADHMIGGSHRPNAEVLAQGFANVASALFGGLPATGALARTATNVRAGGKTPVAGVVHALVILIVMLVAAPLAGYLPMPALAALLIITAWNMSEPHKWHRYWQSPRNDRVLLVLTMLLTILIDLTTAIGVGVAVALTLRLRNQNASPPSWDLPE